MVVSGGGGEEEVFDINFCLPSKIEKFSLAFSQNWPFSWDLKEIESVIELNAFKGFPPKDLEKFLIKGMITNAHALVQCCTTRKRNRNSCYKV